MNGQVLERVSSIKDLGVTLDSNLSWSNHVTSIVAKANQTSYLVKHSIGLTAPTAVKKTAIYKLSKKQCGILQPGLGWHKQT